MVFQRFDKGLKNNKSRDPHSLINYIFKPGVIGLDLQNSLLLMFNRIKEKFGIPEILQFANIISIYKWFLMMTMRQLILTCLILILGQEKIEISEITYSS